MTAVLIDTDVVSFLFKKDSRAKRYLRHLRGQDRILSFMTLAELDQWALRARWGQERRDALGRFVQGYVIAYADRLLCQLWAEVMQWAFRNGQPIDKADAWIAATALALDVPLVTHNAADYTSVAGLRVLSEPE